jgi:hypothetical protein
MKNSFVLFVIVSGVLFTNMHAATKAGYQPATVVSVETRAIPSDYAGVDPSVPPDHPAVLHTGWRRSLPAA